MDEKQSKKEYSKQYQEKNKEKLKEYNKLYYEKNKEYFKEYLKLYYEKNKEPLKEYSKRYYEKKYYEINKRVICKCGCNISKNSMWRHVRSQKHTNLLFKSLN
jgi:hypothetical protein